MWINQKEGLRLPLMQKEGGLMRDQIMHCQVSSLEPMFLKKGDTTSFDLFIQSLNLCKVVGKVFSWSYESVD